MIVLGLLVALFSFLELHSEEINSKTPNLFIDCDGCDENFFKEKIKFVNFVRDRADADIYVMINYQMTGSGGKKYIIDFAGKNNFAGLNDTLVYTIPSSTTPDFRRNKLTDKIRLSLVRYLMKTDFADSLDLKYLINKETNENNSSKIDDPWDYWVYSAELSSYLSGQRSNNSMNIYSSVSADRVTDDLKIGLGVNFNYNESTYKMDTTKILTLTRSRYLYGHLIKSTGNNFSTGIWANYNQNTFSNILHSYSASLGEEYSILPYSEANRIALKLQYKIQSTYNIYEEETIFLKTRELLVAQDLSLIANLKQTWGNIYASVSGNNYFNDFSKYRFDTYTNVSVNLVKGLNINFSFYFSKTLDQFALRRGGIRIEDLLLNRKEMETAYTYSGSFGFSYTFGSMYSNFVNTRF